METEFPQSGIFPPSGMHTTLPPPPPPPSPENYGTTGAPWI